MLRHRVAIILSGLLWMAIGILLLHRGLQYLATAGQAVFNHSHQGFSLILFMNPLFGNSERSAIFLLSAGLVLGFFKGRFILKKTVDRVVRRVRSHPSPISFKQLYSKGYYMIIGSMMLVGFLFKILPIPLEIKGFVDFTVGIALINGAMLYFRAAIIPEHS